MIVDDWIAKKIGLPERAVLDRKSLERWQLGRLRETISLVRANSSFYKEKLAGLPMDFPASLFDLSALPFTTPDEMAADGSRMVCVPARDVSRIVTMQPLATSGTTGEPKRVWFTEADQELMTDYIHHGLPVMTGKDDVFIVLMPCERPGSVGDLVAIGVERIGSRAVRIGTIPADGSRDEEIFEIMRTEGVTTGLMTATTAARLAKKTVNDISITTKIRTVLLSAQFVSKEDLEAIEKCWDCKPYEHYGMTEMGLGGAMACEEREG